MPAKWWSVYKNDEELRVFIGKDGQSGLVRGKTPDGKKDFTWRSIKALSQESGLTEARVEEIVNRYLKSNLIVRSGTGDMFGYWEKADPDADKVPKTAVEKDQAERMKKKSE